MADCISERLRNNIIRRRTSVWPLSALVLGAAWLAGAASARAESPGLETKVSGVRFWSLGGVTRIAIEVNSDFHVTSGRLPNPDRLFFDIQNARPDPPIKGMKVIPVGDALIKQIRVAEPVANTTRVVLDLEQPSEFTASQLSNPARLLVEVRLKGKPAPPALSHSGSTRITDLPPHPAEADVAYSSPAPRVETPVVEPERPVVLRASVSRLEPRRFDPPPVQPRMQVIPDPPPLISAPPAALAMLARPMRMPASSAPRALPPPESPPNVALNVAPNVKVAAPRPQPAAIPARESSIGDRSLTRVLGLKLARVVLDAGHGGHDVGTQGPTGLFEKDLVLDVAKRLGDLLEDRLGSDVIYTRSGDTFVGLEERTRIANEHKADLFLSIHANSSPVKSVSGVETYYLNFNTSKTAQDLASKENASSQHSIFELKELLNKIALKDKIDESREFASRVQTSLYAVSVKGNPATYNRGIKRAPFVVLIGATMPSVLAEIGFLTNAGDEALLRKSEHRDKIAEALYKGIAAYAETLSHFQVAKGQ